MSRSACGMLPQAVIHSERCSYALAWPVSGANCLCGWPTQPSQPFWVAALPECCRDLSHDNLYALRFDVWVVRMVRVVRMGGASGPLTSCSVSSDNPRRY